MKRGIKFKAAPLCYSLEAIAENSSGFITRDGRQVLRDVAARLKAADASPKQSFTWSTLGKPVKTGPSSTYKGGGSAHELEGHFWFSWSCERSGEWWVAYEGSANVQLFPKGTANDPYAAYHIDVCEGGLHVEYDHLGKPKEEQAKAGVRHCFAHSHNGNPMPRLPSVLVTPPDILEFVLTELWPEAWRNAIAGSTGRTNNLKPHHFAQRRRILKVLGALSQLASRPYPISSLHERLSAPVELA